MEMEMEDGGRRKEGGRGGGRSALGCLPDESEAGIHQVRYLGYSDHPCLRNV